MLKVSHFYKTLIGICLGAIILNIARLFLSDVQSYVWMNWNLFLGLLPLLFSFLALQTNKKSLKVLAMLAWLFFLPNAPYMVTDFIHLAAVGPQSLLWFDAIMLFFYTLAGLLAYGRSLSDIRKAFSWNRWFAVIIAVLSGYGIYLGRYIRFNTWDILTRPLEILETIGDTIIHPAKHEPVIMMTLVFTIFLTIFYFSFESFFNHEKTKN